MRQVPRRWTANCDSPTGWDHCFAHWQHPTARAPARLPTPQFQIVGMILVRHAKRRQTPSVFQIWIERKAVVFDGQRSAVAEISMVRLKYCARPVLNSFPSEASRG